MIRYYTANMAGPYHLDNGIPCQDSFYIKRDNNGVVYASTADGLGSESNSDDGSRIASQKSCDYCMEHYMSGMPFSEVKKIMNNAFVNAYKAVLEEAHTAGNSPDEYDTTLCMVIFDDGHVFYGQSGDSGIIALMKSGEYVPLTTQQRDEDGYVFPLCSGPSMWVFGEVEAPVSSVMLMTDGVWEQICPPLLRNHDVKINVTLASRFMDRHETSLRSVKALEEAASRYLENYPRRLLDDDKTIVVIYNPLQPAKKMPAEYYKAPDWVSLQEAAKANLYADDDSADKTLKSSEEELVEHPSEDSNTPVSEDQLDKGNCGLPVSDADDISTHSENDHLHTPDVELDPIVVGSHAKPQRANNSNTNKRHKHIEDAPQKGQIARRRDVGAARLYDFLSVLILVAFSITAFAMNGFVKEHAPETYLGVFLVCFIANSTVLLPAPSILVVLQYSMILNPVVVAICGALGASLGEMVGFMTGVHGRHFVSGKLIRKIEDHFPSHPYIFVLVFSALPLPLFDVVGMMAGAIRLNKFKFYLICLAGKLFKMLMFVWMGQVVANYIPR